MSQQNANKSKRDRSSNFSPAECTLLLKIIEQGFLHVVENKRTDASSAVAKTEAWSKVADAFNAKGLGPPRDVKSLRAKFDAIKRNLRKKDTGWRVTGGGPYQPQPQLTEEERLLRDHIDVSIRGLQPNPNDCDAGFSRGVVPEEMDILETDEIASEVVVDFANYNPSMLMTQRDPALRATSVTPPRPGTPESADNPIASTSAGIVPMASSSATTSAERRTNVTSVTLPPEEDTRNPPPTPNPPPRNIPTTRPGIKRKKSVSSVAGKFEELAEEKLAMVASKKKIIEYEEQTAQFNALRAEVELQKARMEMQITEVMLNRLLREERGDSSP